MKWHIKREIVSSAESQPHHGAGMFIERAACFWQAGAVSMPADQHPPSKIAPAFIRDAAAAISDAIMIGLLETANGARRIGPERIGDAPTMTSETAVSRDAGRALYPGCCHPTHAMRTKCACGRVINLHGAYGDTVALCECGRKHRKNSDAGGSFAHHSYVDNNGTLRTGQRAGGRKGCPGIET